MFCPKCGNELAEGKAFCTKCGAQVAAAPAAVSAAPANSKSFIENIKDFIESLGNAKLFYLGTVVLSTLSFLFMFFPIYGSRISGVSFSIDMFYSIEAGAPMVALVIFAVLLTLGSIAAVVLPAFLPALRKIPFLYAAPAAIYTIIFFYVIIRWFVLAGTRGVALTYPGVIYILFSLGAAACSFFLFWKTFKK